MYQQTFIRSSVHNYSTWDQLLFILQSYLLYLLFCMQWNDLSGTKGLLCVEVINSLVKLARRLAEDVEGRRWRRRRRAIQLIQLLDVCFQYTLK